MLLSLLVAVSCSSPGPDAAGDEETSETDSYVIADVMVFDGERAIGRRSVVILDGTITQVGRTVDPPDGAVSIDGRGKTLLPGLIDAHVHLRDFEALRQAARFGVTTMLDMLTTPSNLQYLRGEAADHPDAADFRLAGSAATAPNGHGTQYGFGAPTLSSASEADAFVRDRIAEGSDYIKIIMEPQRPTLADDTVAAVIDAAHRHGVLAVVHVSRARDAEVAIEAGADGLAHVYWDVAPAGLPALAASRGVFVTPTLTVLQSASGAMPGAKLVEDRHIADRLTRTARAQLLSAFPGLGFPNADVASTTSTRELHDAKVDLLAGTDAPNPGTTFGASLHQELELLVGAGLSATEALAAATSVPARRFNLDDRGRIATGMRADLLLIDGDPIQDITSTRAISDVWVRGHRLPPTGPSTTRESD